MIVLAVDPGNAESAWVLYDGKRVLAKGYDENHDAIRLALQASAGAKVRPAIEMIASYGMPVGKEVFETCVWIGRFIEQLERTTESTVRLVYRAEVKMHLCHSMKAKDGNIRQALIDKLGAPGTKKAPGATYGVSGDAWAALGVAVTAWETPTKSPPPLPPSEFDEPADG